MLRSAIRVRPSFLVAALAAALACGGQSAAQTGTAPTSRAQVQLSFAPIVKQAAPAVVNIYAKKVVRTRTGAPQFSNDPFFKRFFGGGFLSGVPRERVENALGSGVVVGADGLIVTNNHVIQNSDEITVVLSDRREFPAKRVGADERTDLAVLRIDAGGERLPTIPYAPADNLAVGDLVLAIGNPFGVGQTVTSGIVSALARTQVGVTDFRFFIQTDAAINPGNSGGALVDMSGRLVGVNTAIYSRAGGSNGIGFAIPIGMVRAVAEGIVTGGRIVRPWIGASGQSVDTDLAGALGLPRPGGVLVRKIDPGGPAALAGLKPGDLIVALNGREIADVQAMRYRLATLRVGGAATVDILRNGTPLRSRIRLVAPPETVPRDLTVLKGRQPFAGATVANLSPALIEELSLDLDETAQGVIVVKVQGRTQAARIVQPGDRIVTVNGKQVRSVDQLRRLVSEQRRSWNLAIRRGDSVRNIKLRS